MKILVSRHQGAVDWLEARGIKVDKHFTHIEEHELRALTVGDTIYGTLPMRLAATTRARYFNIDVRVPPELQGKELTKEDMCFLGATLIQYEVRNVTGQYQAYEDALVEQGMHP